MDLSVSEISKLLKNADEKEFLAISRSLSSDTRKGVINALKAASNRLEGERRERERIESMYSFELEVAEKGNDAVIVGLDEVGRGSVAGPLAVGAVVLDRNALISGLNDSKKLSPQQREILSEQIRSSARAWAVDYVDVGYIDEHGMSHSLREAFKGALAAIENQIEVDIVLIDGNPLGIDPRERNVVKGDSRCASIAAASIVAKVDRDALMTDLDHRYPEYAFAENKGYGTAAHLDAIKRFGLTPVHRRSFCTAFDQPSLF